MSGFTTIPVVTREDILEVSKHFNQNHGNEPFWYLDLMKKDGQDQMLIEIHNLTEGITKNDKGKDGEKISFEHVNARGFIRGLAFGYMLLRNAQARKKGA